MVEFIKTFKVKKFIFASSSSVYGDQKPFPKLEQSELNPINLYSLSKLSNEQFARSMSKSMNTKFVGLRFFTIYGPWGRPDMLIIKYLIASTKKIKFLLYNKGDHYRDFTYIDDAVNICESLVKMNLKKKYDIFNICSSKPLLITKVLNEVNKYSKSPFVIKKPRDKADVYKTYGDNKKIRIFLGKKISFTNFKFGIKETCKWYFKNFKLF